MSEEPGKVEDPSAPISEPETNVGDGDVTEGGTEITEKTHDDAEGEEKIGTEEKLEGEEKVGVDVDVANDEIDGEGLGEEHVGEEGDREQKLGEGEELMGEHAGELMGEEMEGEHLEEEEKKEDVKAEEVKAEEVEEEEQYVEEPPPDPAAPYNFSDSQEAIKERFELRPDQLAEVEQLWAEYQDYTPAYTDIDNYITEKELIYMLKSLMLMTYTPEQLDELITYCVRPPHPNGHINFDQFVKMVTIRQRDFPIEEELRTALQVMDPDKTNSIDREFMKEVLSKQGHKMPAKQLDNLLKEVDMSNDGTIGIDDVVGTMCIDLNREDIIMLRNSIFPPEVQPEEDPDADD